MKKIEDKEQMYFSMKKMVNQIEKYYIIVTIMCYALCEIAPVVAIIKYTPLYSYQRYLGIIGILVITIDIILNKTIYTEKHSLYIYILLLIATIASVTTSRYGIKENIFNLTWTLIMFLLFYKFSFKCDEKQLKNICRKLYYIIATIWLVSIIFSIASFLYNTGYDIVTNPYTPGAVTRQGFFENRLFGVFMSINDAAIMAGILLIISIYMLCRERRIYAKIFCSISFVFDSLFIILSGSRSAYYGLLCISAIYIVYVIYSHLKINMKFFAKSVISLVVGLILLSCIIMTVSILENILGKLPTFSFFENNKIYYEQFIEKISDTEMLKKETETKETEVKETEVKETDILQRKDIEGNNISNNRFNIWENYLGLYKQIGLVGLSPCNYSKVIARSNPDIYIVKHIRDFYPDLYAEGKIYHPHSMYLAIYVFTGVIGTITFLTFWILCLKDLIRYFKYCKGKMQSIILVGIMIVIYGLFTSIFDQGLFFLTNIISCIFWIALGYVMKSITEK